VIAGAADERIVIRRELRDGDAQAIIDLHERVYVPEYGVNARFVSDVAGLVHAAVANGWPASGGAVWLVDHAGRVDGSVALTDEGEGIGHVRWVVLSPDVRGHGLGRSLVTELVTHARASGFRRLELETFSALTVAARLYKEAGFRLLWSRPSDKWGPPITYQGYALDLE
jgi:ribosomal protein S18 acetylase RimI-like enzyme